MSRAPAWDTPKIRTITVRSWGRGRYTHREHLGVGTFRIPAAGAPANNVQDNTAMLGFNQNDTEDAYTSWEVPSRYAGGDLGVQMHWTNDGGIDDNGKNVRWEVNYQTMDDGDSVAGNHASSPKVIDDTYTSATGYLMHTSPMAAIAAADFAAAHEIRIRLTALAAAPVQLTGESQLTGILLMYDAWSTVI